MKKSIMRGNSAIQLLSVERQRVISVIALSDDEPPSSL